MNTHEPQVAIIKAIIAETYGVTAPLLDSRTKTKTLALARAVAMYLCRELLKMTYPEIATAFSRLDHGSAMWSVKVIIGRRNGDGEFRWKLDALSARVAASLNPTK